MFVCVKWHSLLIVWSLQRKVYEHTIRTQIVQIVLKSTYVHPRWTEFRTAIDFRQTNCKIKKAILKDRRVMVWDLSKVLNVSKTSIDNFWTDYLKYTKICVKWWVQRMLTDDYKRQCNETVYEFLELTERIVRIYWILLSLGIKSGFTTPHNLVSENI